MAKGKSKVNLPHLFMDLQKEMVAKLSTGRRAIRHPGSKGDDSELNWRNWLKNYLPSRYSVDKAFVIDSRGAISDQIDLVIYDCQYSPFLFKHEGAMYIPAESIYAVFEVKQALDKKMIQYAGEKAASVRKLYRTSAEITHAGGKFTPREPIPIFAGILSLDSKWKPLFGSPLKEALVNLKKLERLDFICALKNGSAEISYNANRPVFDESKKNDALIFFFFALLARLQKAGTCPAIEYSEYAKALIKR
ncbi:MAG: hypothetical protein FP824_07755 [Euryarchaeota archaeon]|nr:hypothetical protein [Euryarchaeota archaeon]MBU4038009.1 hypothetical protein [Pseudomonadota bacterium]